MLYALPTGWEEFSTELLEAELARIKAMSAKVDIDADATDDGPSGLEVAESLADAKEAVKAVLGDRTEKAAEAEARREAVMSRLADPEPEPEPEPEPTPEPEAQELADESDPEPEPEPEGDPEPAPAVELADETPAPETVTDPAPVEDPTATTEPPKAPKETLAAMNAQRTPADNLTPRSATTAGRMRPINGERGWDNGEPFSDIEHLSEALSGQLERYRTIGKWSGEHKPVALVTSNAEFSDDMRLSGQDIQHNYEVTSRAARQYEDAIVASGGPCAPLMPMYEFYTCYSPQMPIEAGLPVVGAPRGGIRFLNQVPLGGEAAAAITQKDSADSALLPGDAGFTAKNCTRVACPTETTVTVGSISQCVTFDNLNFRVFPEQVRNMLERVQIEYTKAKEVFYLNRLVQIAGAPVDIAAAQANPFGAGRSLFRDLVVAGHNYRKRNNMSRDAMLDVWLPDGVEDLLAIDMVNDNDMNALGSVQAGPNGNLTDILARRARLNVRYYYYDATEAGFVASAHDGAAAVWNPIPARFQSFMHAPGAVVRLDAGQLDLGIVRDSTLNGQNDLQMFAEQWLEVANPGCEVNSFIHEACYSGVGPMDVAAPACP